MDRAHIAADVQILIATHLLHIFDVSNPHHVQTLVLLFYSKCLHENQRLCVTRDKFPEKCHFKDTEI